MNKKKRTGLDNGFVFLYEWLPAFSDLDGEDFKRLLLALIDRQRNGTPLPHFESKQVAIYAQMMEPVIIRRLDGQRGGYSAKGGRENASATVVPTIVPTIVSTVVPSSNRVQAREEKIREDISPLSVGEGETRAPAHAETPPPRERVIEDLRSEGIPSLYVAERYARAIERGGNIEEILRSWWASDRAEWEKLHGSEIASFDTDTFFEAALRRSYGDQYDEIYGRSVMV